MTRGSDRRRRSTASSLVGSVTAVQRPLASGLTIAGVVLIVLGLGRALLVLEVLPAEVADVVGTWWPAVLVAGGGWLVARGRRVTGTVLALVGVLLLVSTVVPEGFVGPTLLIGLGLLLLFGATGGRRWMLGGGTVALFDDVRSGSDGAPPSRSYVAVFGESEGRLDPSLADEGVVECLAVFGDVRVRVPADVAVELSETAVFGDVRSPEPARVPTVATVAVRATAVFGDVKLLRD